MRDIQLTKRLIFAVLALLLAVDLALGYYNRKMSSARENPQQILAAQNRQLALLKADVKRASEIRQRIPDVLKKFDQFESSLPPATKGYSLLSQEMDEAAHESHLLIGDTKYRQKDLTDHNLVELEFESSVTGDYVGIVRFLNRLQRSKNVYIVDSLAVDSQTQGQGLPGTLRISLHLRTYFRKA
jgi:Tfp pilus assembly protein PilO